MVAKHIINMDELKARLNQAINEAILEKLNELIESFQINNNTTKIFFSKDMSLNIPAIKAEYVSKFIATKALHICGITFSQTGYNKTDCISLLVNDNLIIDKIYSKELGQYKDFSNAVKVEEDEEVKVIFHNDSGHSKIFFCEIDYIHEEE